MKLSRLQWTIEIMEWFKRIGHMSRTDAKRYFLQILRHLRCDKCVDCEIVVQNDFPVHIEETTKRLRLNTTCAGLFFFKQDPSDHFGEYCNGWLRSVILKIDFYHLASIHLFHLDQHERDFLNIQAVINGKLKRFRVATNFGKRIMAAVDAHAPKVEREAILNKYTRKHGVSGSVHALIPVSNLNVF